MNRLWAPWRVGYITEVMNKKKGCVFCKIVKEKKDKKNFILIRSESNFAVLNTYPYNNGHTLLMPYRHVRDLSKLNKKELQFQKNLGKQEN